MRFKKCLLVRLPYGHRIHRLALIPVGLGYIAEALQRAGVAYDVFDMMFQDQGCAGFGVPDLLAKIRAFQPDLVGFSMMTMRYKLNYAVLREVKAAFPELAVAVGGPHVSTLRERVLEECSAIDYGFILEADESFPAFCAGKNPAEVPGLIYRDRGKVRATGNPELIRDLDRLPFPRYERFDLARYHPAGAMAVVTSRGCPHLCTYCPVKLAIGQKFRCVSARALVDEIIFWRNRGRRQFVIWDDNFTFHQERVLEFCEGLAAAGGGDCQFSIPNGVRADRVDRRVLERLRQTGFSELAIGVESGSDAVLKTLRKGQTVAQVETVIRDALDLGYRVCLFFMIGAPGETAADVERSFDLARKYPVAEARFYKMIPFPGTELFDWVQQHKLFIRPPEEYLNDADHFGPEPCFETPELPRRERIRLFKRGRWVSRRIMVDRRKRQWSRLGWLGRGMAEVSALPMVVNLTQRVGGIRQLALWVQRRMLLAGDRLGHNQR